MFVITNWKWKKKAIIYLMQKDQPFVLSPYQLLASELQWLPQETDALLRIVLHIAHELVDTSILHN